jgi:hypothetical protein
MKDECTLRGIKIKSQTSEVSLKGITALGYEKISGVFIYQTHEVF